MKSQTNKTQPKHKKPWKRNSVTLLHYLPIDQHLSLTGKRWSICIPENIQHDIVATLAHGRGINIEQKTTWELLSNPTDLHGVTEACNRIHTAIAQNVSIGIIGDYDADGITGTAQLTRFFLRRNMKPHIILPHRERDGYGVKKSFIDQMKAGDVTLIITVDTGVSAIEEIAYARSLGMDVIVTDHHSLKEELPDAIVVHPKAQKEDGGTLNNLSGSGVVFTLIRALEEDNWAERDTDCAIAAIGTVADIVPLTGENRTIVQLGLRAMNNNKPSTASIFHLAQSTKKSNEPLTATHIGFRIAPRINAAGRIDEPMLALSALLDGGKELEQLQQLNEDRREATREHMELAHTMVNKTNIITLHSDQFHPGIIGLVAGRLTEEFGKPTIIGCLENEQITCSLRSIPAYNITEALTRHSIHLTSFGGHAQAAGCSLSVENWNAFTMAMEEDITARCSEEDLTAAIIIDAELVASNLTFAFAKRLEALEPFGEANREPRFLLRNLPLENIRTVGADSSHLQCKIEGIQAIGFRLGHLTNKIPVCADIVCRIGINAWKGRESVQLFIEDIRTAKAVALHDTSVTQA